MSYQPSLRRKSALVLGVTYLAFIVLGLPDSVLGVAWPTLRVSLGLSVETVGLLTLVLTLVSAAASFGAGTLVKRFSAGPVLAVSSLVTGLALLEFSFVSSFPALLLAAVPLGLGAGTTDSGLNSYVAENYDARHMNWLHAFWGGGATLGPLVMTLALGTKAGWRGGYLWIALAQFLVACLVLGSLPFWKKAGPPGRRQARDFEGSRGSLPLKSPAAALSVALFFLYAAAELGSGLWANTVLVDGRQVAPGTAGIWVACFYGAISAGRLLVGFLAGRWGNRRLVAGGLVLGAAGAALFGSAGLLGSPVWVSPVGLGLLGLGLAPVYPCLMHEVPRRFSPQAAPVVIGWQVGAAYAGSAVLPGLLGWTMARTSLEILAPAVVLVLGTMALVVRKLNRMA